MRGNGGWYVVVQSALMVAALLAPVLGARPASWPVAAAVLGGLLAVAGLGLTLAASLALGRRSLSPFPTPKAGSTLVQGSIFATVRHPIYTGLTVFVLGWGVGWGSIATIVGALVLLVFFDFKARREERLLEAKFADYAGYKRRVKKLIPFVY